jgi:hypothetical protein
VPEEQLEEALVQAIEKRWDHPSSLKGLSLVQAVHCVERQFDRPLDENWALATLRKLEEAGRILGIDAIRRWGRCAAIEHRWFPAKGVG